MKLKVKCHNSIYSLFILILYLLNPSIAKSEIINLMCEFEFGKGLNSINEKEKIITVLNSKFDYRVQNDEIIYEVVDFENKTLSRNILNLNTLKKSTVHIAIDSKLINEFEELLEKFENKKINYQLINKKKINLFQEKFINPSDYPGKKIMHFRKSEWPKSDKSEYLIFNSGGTDVIQAKLVEFCEIKN